MNKKVFVILLLLLCPILLSQTVNLRVTNFRTQSLSAINSTNTAQNVIIQAGSTADQNEYILFRDHLGVNAWTVGRSALNHWGIDSNTDGSNRLEINYNESMIFRTPANVVAGQNCGRF